MSQPKSRLPTYREVSQKLDEQIMTGEIKVPLEDSGITLGQLIRGTGYYHSFGLALEGQKLLNTERFLIMLMAMGKMFGEETPGLFSSIEKWGTPKDILQKERYDLCDGHQRYGVIKGDLSNLDDYMAKLDVVAQQFVDKNYPDVAEQSAKREVNIR